MPPMRSRSPPRPASASTPCSKPSSTACRPPRATSTPRSRRCWSTSWYDTYLGVVVLIRVIDGTIKKGQKIRMMAANAAYELDRVGVFTPKLVDVPEASAPARSAFSPPPSSRSPIPMSATPSPMIANPPRTALPGFRPAQPVVFCGLFPVDASDFETLRDAMGKLRLNDASFSFEMETSAALGFGFRCGFLGLLHLEIIQERLSREFNLDLIATAPSASSTRSRSPMARRIQLHNPADMPEVTRITRNPRALDQGDHPHARRISRRHPEALPGPARHPAAT